MGSHHGSWSGRVFAALVVALSLALYWLGQPVTAAQGNQGLQGGWAIDDLGNVSFDKSVVATLPLMQEAGAGWVRINFRLGACFVDWTTTGCNGKTALETYDQVVAAAQGSGLKVLGLLSNESWHGDQTQWVAGSAEQASGNGDNAYLRDFSLKAAVPLAGHFAGRVATWEVWNEPNAWTSTDGQGNYSGGTFIYPSNFAWLLRHVYEDTRGAGITGVQFLSGGVFGHDSGGAAAVISTPAGPRSIVKYGAYPFRTAVPTTGPEEGPLGRGVTPAAVPGDGGASYLTSTYQYGLSLAGWDELKRRYGSYPLDGVGQHLYVDQGGATSASKIGGFLRNVRSAYTAYEGRNTTKQTHVTEVGWSSSLVAEATQASNLKTAYDTFRKTAYVARAYWFFIQDIPGAALYYGLVRADNTHKPAFTAYQGAAAY